MVLMTDSYFEFEEKALNQKVEVNFEWLRENCRCSTCYNKVTNQRNIRIFDIDPGIQPVAFSTSGNEFIVNWSDGHQSVYDLGWILSQSRREERPPEKLWSGDVSNKVEYVSATEVKSQHGITRLVKSLLQYGVGFVTNSLSITQLSGVLTEDQSRTVYYACVQSVLQYGILAWGGVSAAALEPLVVSQRVDPNVASTEEVIRHVGPPRRTLFGDMWEFSDNMDHMDTAYTNQALDPHTDTCYFIEPAGLIIFHCIKRNCTGGQTLLVDGFRAAKQVEQESPQHYQCLKSVHTEFQYIEKGHHLTCVSPVIHHWPEDRIKQIRYNLYDRSARLPQPSSETSLFYASLRHLASAVSEPRGHWWLTLEPGTVAFINNWRVLHGRSAYSGARTITGAYVSMGNLLSRARLLKVLL